jgi:tetratricopeptide (TPR) repeat protein
LTLSSVTVRFRFKRGYPGGKFLSRQEKLRALVDHRRRNFLVRCCQGAAGAALWPAGLRDLSFAPKVATALLSFPLGESDFHLHPHYRTPRPLDALLLKTQAGSDEFITEKYADQIGAVLADWSSQLLRTPAEVDTIAKALAPDFSGFSLEPVETKRLRSHAGVRVDRNTFGGRNTADKETFLRSLRTNVISFSKIITAEMQITEVEVLPQSPNDMSLRVRTRVRYELVGTGRETHREQRVGDWDLEWKAAQSGEFRIARWNAANETHSTAVAPMFADITTAALGGAPSYSAQLLKGADYWRTVLDGASGIDIYGHNGVSVGDIDNDGYDDLYICQPAGLPNRLYRNRGDGTFEDVTESAGVGLLENTACALFVDVDNDGRQDLIVVRTNGPLLFLNEGSGKFRQKPDAFQFTKPPAGTFTGAAVADYDRDGWLDIYFCLYVYYQGTDQYKYPTPYYDAENGPPNFLLRNNRDGTFRDVTVAAGLDQHNTRYSFCCAWNDYNADGWPDLYVVNDFGRKNLYRNNGDGTFTDVAANAGVEDIGAGMSVCWLDYDNDSAMDLYVADMWTAAGKRVATQDVFHRDAPDNVKAWYRKHAMGNSLFRSAGKGAFQDVSAAAGVEMGRWAWSSDAWDFDHDGLPDLYVVNGMVSGPSRDDLNSFFWRQVVAKSPSTARSAPDYEQGWSAINELIRADDTWSGYERNVLYVNNGDGTFSDVSGAAGIDFLEDGRSFALADFDHDGRFEMLVKNRNAPQVRLMKNVIHGLGASASFRLRGTKCNRDAIGATVIVETGAQRQARTLQAGSGFLSQHSKEVFFGLGDAKDSFEATIRWPSGLVQELQGLPVNHRIWVEEGTKSPRLEPFKSGAGHAAVESAAVSKSEELPDTVETWLLEPVAAPDFTLQDLGGKTTSLAGFRGKPVLLHLWAAETKNALEGIRNLDQKASGWGAAGMQVVTVSLDPPEVERVRQLASQNQLRVPILLGTEDFAAVYNILYRYLFDRHRDLTLPTSFLIDVNGEIVKVYQGAFDFEQVARDVQHIPRNVSERMAAALPFPGITTVSDFSRNYLSYGSVFFQRGYLEPAKASFERALRDDPSSAEALYGLGSVYLQQQNASDAKLAFERATKATAGYPDTLPNAWNNLGLLATREGRTAESIPYFKKALEANPDHVIALVNLGNAYRQQKEWDLAKATMERAVEVGPDDAEANYGLGMVYAQLNDSDRAYQHLQRALKLRPEYPEALNNLGILYLRTQRPELAVAAFEECIRASPGFDQSYLNLARVYAVEGQPAKAREILQALLKQHPEHTLAKKALAELGQ